MVLESAGAPKLAPRNARSIFSYAVVRIIDPL